MVLKNMWEAMGNGKLSSDHRVRFLRKCMSSVTIHGSSNMNPKQEAKFSSGKMSF
jgi:hypothetical protein